MFDRPSIMFGPTPMRLFPLLLAACLVATPGHAQGVDRDDGFDDRGVDRHDRAPDWNYRRGETEGKGAYYDGGRYGPHGLLGTQAVLDPWLAGAETAGLPHVKVNRDFRELAARNRDATLTDEEIALALTKRVSR